MASAKERFYQNQLKKGKISSPDYSRIMGTPPSGGKSGNYSGGSQGNKGNNDVSYSSAGGNVMNFKKVLMDISQNAYKKGIKFDTKNNALTAAGVSPSDVSGSTFESVMSNLESMTGDQISKEYSATVSGYESQLQNAITAQKNIRDSADKAVAAGSPVPYSSAELRQAGIDPADYGLTSVSIPANTLAARNNNPGNLRFVGQAGASQGQGGFARFATPEDGFNALKQQIELDKTRGMTVAQFCSKYAPPSENNTTQYITQICEWLGTNPETPLSQVDTNAVAQQISRKESGTTIIAGATATASQTSQPLSARDWGTVGALQKSTGQDGFVDPDVYKQTRDKWLQDNSGQTQADFDAKFGTMLNPSDAPNLGVNQAQKSNESYNKYGLLGNVQDFNPANKIDQEAKQYLDYYIKNAAVPTYYTLFGRSASGNSANFAAIANRAQDLFFAATGQSLPDVQILKSNKGLISANNKLLNNLNIQEGTVNLNFKLALDNIDKNGINQSAPAINQWINSIKDNLLGDPGVAQYLAQNNTVANEMGSLLALKNATGTTVADKLAAAGLIPVNASEAQQKEILRTLMQEAENGRATIMSTSSDLWSQIDPLQTDPSNPARKQQVGVAGQDGTNQPQGDQSGTWEDFQKWQSGNNQSTNNQPSGESIVQRFQRVNSENAPWWQKLWDVL